MTVAIALPELGSNVVDARKIYGRWQTNGTGVPVKVYGRGLTLARTGVGVYTVTCNDIPGGALMHANVTWRRATAVDSRVAVLTWTTSGVLTLTHTTFAAPTVAAEWPATATDVELSVELIIGSTIS